MPDILTLFGAAAAIVAALWLFGTTIRIIPEQEAWVVEMFGRFQKVMGPGFHLLLPVAQRVAYKQILKEEVIDVPPQICITKDNVQVSVDGILYLKVLDPQAASYGIDNFRFATIQLAQTTMRSEIGKMVLDKTFSERETMNNAIVKAIDEASDPWGIKVTRYEIRDIIPAKTILEAMEAQVRAEREKRAGILSSEGHMESRINTSKGERQEAINLSQGERQRRINEADGRAEAIRILAEATAQGITEVASAIREPNGDRAVSLRLTEQYLQQLQAVLDRAQVSVFPHDLAAIQGVVQSLLPQVGKGKVQ